MKTLLVALEFPPAVGGVETYYKHVIENWPEEIQVLDNSEKRLVRGPWRWLPGLFSVAAKLREYKPDWVIVGEILPIGTIAWLLSYLFSVNYAVVLHGLDFSLATRSLQKRWLSGRILTRASRIIAVNSYTAELIAQQYPATNNKIAVVNPGAEPMEPAGLLMASLKENYDLDNAFVVLTLGRLVKRKGVDMVLRAIHQLVSDMPEVRYVVIGNGPDKEYLKVLIDELELDRYVIMLPAVSPEERAAWLNLADVFAMPARNLDGDYEGFGIVYLDAGMAGKPVIAGKSGGVRDAVSPKDNGLIVNEEDPAEIAAAIKRLHDDPALRQQLGENGKRRALVLTWSQQIEKLHAALQ